MSTKIYNAWRADKPASKVFAGLVKWRRVIRERASNQVVAAIAAEYENESRKEAMPKIVEILDRNIRRPIAVQCSAVVYPIAPKTTLLTIHGTDEIERCPRVDAFVKGIRDYHYQNQTDRPDSISADEWKARKQTWGLVFAEWWQPCRAGLVFEIVTAEDIKSIARQFLPLESPS